MQELLILEKMDVQTDLVQRLVNLKEAKELEKEKGRFILRRYSGR